MGDKFGRALGLLSFVLNALPQQSITSKRSCCNKTNRNSSYLTALVLMREEQSYAYYPGLTSQKAL